MKVRYLRAARRDLVQIAEYIARDDPDAAKRVVERIRASAELLTDYPAMGRPGRLPGTRELVVPTVPYLLPYRVRRAEVVIVRVLHQAQRWPPR